MKKSVMSIAIAAAVLSMGAQASEFNGYYVGGKLGLNKSDIAGTPTAASKNSSTMGLEVGRNWDMGNFLLGVDLFADFNSKASHAMTPATAFANYGSNSWGVDLKLGIPSGNWMPYAKLGVDNTKSSVNYGVGATLNTGNHAHVGVGVEYKFKPQWAVAVEWTRTAAKDTLATLTNNNLTVGFNYYFSAPPAPVVVPVVKKEEPAPAPAPVVVKKEPVYKTVVSDKLVTIEGTSFDSGSAKLKKAANKQLDTVVDFANKNKDANVAVTGYTDDRGSDKLNAGLSKKRAESVKAYLVKKGVAANRITAEGKGKANPVADNKTSAGRAKNRRVEINSVLKEEKKVQVQE